MSYHGGSGPGNGYYNGFGPPSTYGAQENRPPYPQHARPPCPSPVNGGTSGGHQYNPQPYGMMEYSQNQYYQAPTVRPQETVQPQFISPAQMFQQTPSHTTYLDPSSLSRTPSTPSLANPAGMGHPVGSTQQVDQSTLLLALAEEYFEAAYALAPSMMFSMTRDNTDTYQQLVATGLGCLEAVLKNLKLSPRLEATVRLRYAGVLYEETDNAMEAETTLSKGIGLCERNHYFDLKYAMQYLLAKLLAKKNPKAAMKALDGHISEAEAYQHISWVYALRFLRASYAMESDSILDNVLAVQNLQKIAELATRQGDRAIHLAASLQEALAHLRTAGPDSNMKVNTAIAAARTHQLGVGQSIPQLNGLTHIIDAMASFRQGNLQDMFGKLKAMQTTMDEILHQEGWSDTSDVLAIPINRTPKSSQTVSHETRAILGIAEDGRDNLMMSFMNRRDAFAMTYLMCGVGLLQKTPADVKVVNHLDTGIAHLMEDIRSSKLESGLLPELVARNNWRGQLLCYFHLYLGLAAAECADWKLLLCHIEELKAAATEFEIAIDGPLECLLMYYTGVYHQGTGNFDAALQIFQDPKFNLPTATNTSNISSSDQLEQDFALLAALNTLWILQDSPRQNLENNAAMLERLEPMCSRHPNTNIQTAFNLAMAAVKTNPPAQLFTVKKYLGAALNGAQAKSNAQFLCLVLNLMCSRFFSNVIGQQAEKSAKVASVRAEMWGNNLWRSVADGMFASHYEVAGKKEEAQASMENARRFSQKALSQMVGPTGTGV